MVKSSFLKFNQPLFRKWKPGDLPLTIELWGDPEVTRYIDARVKLSKEDFCKREKVQWL